MSDFDKQQAIRAAEATWAASPAIRAEFSDNKAEFVAYRVGVASGSLRMNAAQRAAEAQDVRDVYAAFEAASVAYAKAPNDPAALDAYVTAKRAYEAIRG